VDSTILSQSYSIILSQPAFASAIDFVGRSYDYGLTWLSSGHSGSYSVTSILDGEINFQLAPDFRTISTNYSQTWSSATNRPAGGSTQWDNDAIKVSNDGSVAIARGNSSPENQGIWVSNDVFATAGTQVFPAGSTSTSFRPQNGCISQTGQYAFVENQADGLYRSTDFGITWSKVTTGTQSINKSMCSDDGQYVYYAKSLKVVYRSNNFGATFSIISGVTADWVDCSANGQIVYCRTSAGLLKSTNFGVSFTNVNVSVNSIVKCDRSGNYCAYIDFAASPRRFNVSADGGVTFTDRAPSSDTWSRFNLGRN
jgi:hypothetical protein